MAAIGEMAYDGEMADGTSCGTREKREAERAGGESGGGDCMDTASPADLCVPLLASVS